MFLQMGLKHISSTEYEGEALFRVHLKVHQETEIFDNIARKMVTVIKDDDRMFPQVLFQ